jgi:hypothetical protein
VLWFFTILFLSFFCFLEIENNTINAISEACRRRSIIEYMAKVRLASPTLYFRPDHPVSTIRRVNYTAFANGFVKTGPSATAFKFGIATEQGVPTSCAILCSFFIKIFKLTGPWSLGAFLTSNVVHLSGKNFLPFGFGQVDL